MNNLFHIRVVDSTRLSGRGGPEALIAIADVPRRYQVGIPSVAALDARKVCLIASVVGADRSARRATSARVSRIDMRYSDAGESSLVLHDGPQTMEAPGVQSSPGLLSSRFNAATDVSEVLEDERIARPARCDELLSEHMIAIAAETCESATEANEMPLRRLAAFRLKPTTERQHAFFGRSPLGFTKKASVTGYCWFGDSPINADDFTGKDGFLHVTADRDVKEPALLRSDDFSASGLEPAELLGMSIKENGSLYPTVDDGKIDRSGLPVELKSTSVEADPAGSRLRARDCPPEFLKRFSALYSFDRLHSGGDDKLTRQRETLSKRIVRRVMYGGLVNSRRFPRALRADVEGVSVLEVGGAKKLSMLRRKHETKPSGLNNDHGISIRATASGCDSNARRRRRFLHGLKAVVSAPSIG